MTWTCDLCEMRETENTYIDRHDKEEKFVCDFCRKGHEIDYVSAEDRLEAELFFDDLVKTEEAVCGLPEDAWDGISSVLNNMERRILGDFLRLRNHEAKAKAVEGAHRGLLR